MTQESGCPTWAALLLAFLVSSASFGDDPFAPPTFGPGDPLVQPQTAWAGNGFYFDDSPPEIISTPLPAPGTEELQTWESQLSALEERLDGLDEKDTEFDESITSLDEGKVDVGTSNSSIKLSGRIHADYWAFPGDDDGAIAFEGMNPQDRFIFRRVRFGVAGDIGDQMTYKIEMEFSGGSDPTYKDVYFGFTDLPFLQTLLVGNQKRPYGLDHINSSRYNVFMERPFIIEAHNQDARRLGVQSYGFTEDLRYNWRYGIFNMEDPQTDSGYIGDHYQLEVAGRFAHTWFYDECCDGQNYGHFAIAGSVAHPDATGGPLNANEARFRTRPEARTEERWLNTGRMAGAEYYEILAFESVYNEGPLQLVGEVQSSFVQRDGFDDPNFWGGYAYIAYFLTGEHIPWEREDGQLGRVKPKTNFFLIDKGCGCWEEGWGAWQIAARYSYADFTDEDITGGVGNSMTLGLNWHWNPNARLQFNYIRGWIDDRGPVAGETSAVYDIIGMRGMVDF